MDPRRRARPRHGLAIACLLLVAASAVALASAPRASAVTYVNGAIAADTTWGLADDTYVVTGHVTVKPGATLTILPGTAVRMDPGVALYVEGALLADGVAGNPIAFQVNNSIALAPPFGIQFNASSSGSVSWATFDRFERPVSVRDSNPLIANNVVGSALIAFSLERSSGIVSGNTVDRAFIGILLSESDGQVLGNAVNGTSIAIEAVTSGSPLIDGNFVTNVSSSFAVAILTGAGTSPTIQDNGIQGVRGSRGGSALLAGESGNPGGSAFGILVDSPGSVVVDGNTIDVVAGGSGGNGAGNPGGTGGRGGDGGPAAGIVVIGGGTVSVTNNDVTNVSGGRGGAGGGGGTTAIAGHGGDAGDAAGIYLINVATSAQASSNGVQSVFGGSGGTGGDGTSTDGNGGSGGEVFGTLAQNSRAADFSGNWILDLLGGFGGNSTISGGGNGLGGKGGDASALVALQVVGTSLFHFNTVSAVTGGEGGRGAAGGAGGNATGALAFGYDDGNFNVSSATSNWIEIITGGLGGDGTKEGGDGGIASGLSGLLVSVTSSSNVYWDIQGGAGGDAGDGSDGGRGGDAAGFVAYLVPSGSSVGDWIDTVTKGGNGAGLPAQVAYGRGYYVAGNASVTTRLTIENVTLAGVGNYDLWVDNYTGATTINTPFNAAKVSIQAAGNLTVKNYLTVEAYWPDGVTLVAGTRIRVFDDGATVWDVIAPTGARPWLLVTDRIYINSNVATQNTTDVEVSYLTYSFVNDPRSVDMAASITETFVMIDSDAPSSSASALPIYTNTATFSVAYTASDGNGGGLNNVTLWYRLDGGGWTAFGTQAAGNAGAFSFTAAQDGLYEFATVADDVAGNAEPGPAANDTWTIVDTLRPGSGVAVLGPYQTSASFLVSWAPDAGVTDIASYTIQYNRGAGWVDWLVNTTQASATFVASPASGVYQFRSIATDRAGNVENPPVGNDTWTIVDTAKPFSIVAGLSTYQTSLGFLVGWGPQFDTFDIATYRIEVNDNGTGWSAWIPSTTATSATFTGQDGHLYQFRSIATDRAGNVENPPVGNDTWTIVDVTTPDSRVTPLQPYYTSLTFTVAWSPASGTSDITTYTLEASDNGGPWIPVAGSINTGATSALFIGVDGHAYAFRTIARDRAGNLEAPSAGNDTWTIVDVTKPFATSGVPRGSNVNTTPTITITFSEPMNRASVEQAFSLSPDMNGAFLWSADSRVVTFIPERPLEPGVRYVVVIDSSARDLAGNTATGLYTFEFTTAAAPPLGLAVTDMWWVLAAIGAAIGGTLFFLMRKRATAQAPKPAASAAAPAKGESTIDDVFLLYRDGVLIKHETRRLKPDIDTDILSGMLTAVQHFVKDSFRSEEGELDELTFGQMHILIGRGKWLILAAMIQGDGTDSMTEQIKQCIQDMENHQWDQLEDWDGDMALAKVLAPYVKKLIRGDYSA